MMMFSSPEEVERHQAIHDMAAHDIVRLMEELPLDQLKTIGYIFDSISMADGATAIRTSSYLAGRVSSQLQTRFNICAACGKDHDDDLKELTKTDHDEKCPSCESPNKALHPATQADGGEVTLCKNPWHNPVEVPPFVAARRKIDEQAEPMKEPQRNWTPVGSTAQLREFEHKKMTEWDLDDLRNEDTGELLGFICNNCKMRYESIESRMAEPKGVDGCSGCQQKAKFG